LSRVAGLDRVKLESRHGDDDNGLPTRRLNVNRGGRVGQSALVVCTCLAGWQGLLARLDSALQWPGGAQDRMGEGERGTRRKREAEREEEK
jgi:hypothetical protein